MTIETEHDLAKLRTIGQITALILRGMLQRIEPGMTTRELDAIGRGFFEQYQVRSAPQLCYKFPGFTCISVNEEAAHGVPSDRVISAGDVVNVDVSAELDGYFADTGGTMVVPPVTPLKDRLLQATQIALSAAMSRACADAPLNSIGHAIQKVAKDKGFKVIKNLCSHGVGRSLHEEPKQIPGFFDPKDQRRLSYGMVITIEPFLATKNNYVVQADDGWTLLGSKSNLSAQFEHTMVITRGQPIVVTQPD